MDGDSDCGSAAGDLAGAAVAALSAAVDLVLTLEPSSESRDPLLALARGMEVQARRLGFVQLAVCAELEERNVPSELLLRGLPDLIAVERGVTWRSAREEARAVERFGPRRAVTGEALEPLFPACATALAVGEIHAGHAKLIADQITELPEPVRAAHAEDVEATLVEHAKTMDPRALGVLARRVVAHLAPDGREPADDWPRRSRSLDFAPPCADGTVAVKGRLSPEAAAVWGTIFGSMSEALTDNPGEGPAGGGSAGDLGKDRRTPSQQRHDAFELAGRRLLSMGKLPDHAGLPATLLITMTLADLERRAGVATTHTGGALTIGQALQLAADAKKLPAVLAGDPRRPGKPGGEVLYHGKGRRLADDHQRTALFVRDRGCTFPGCAASAADSEVHHAPDWVKGGLTDVDKMTISCGYHNREAIAQGWTTEVTEGTAWWTPPPWLDPGQKPRRNYVHHPELLLPEPEPPPETEPEEADEGDRSRSDEDQQDSPEKPPPGRSARRAQQACGGCGQRLVDSVGSVRGSGDSDAGLHR
jgi:hypothetical protein